MTKKIPVPERLRRQVRERAQGRCEYCLIHFNDPERVTYRLGLIDIGHYPA